MKLEMYCVHDKYKQIAHETTVIPRIGEHVEGSGGCVYVVTTVKYDYFIGVGTVHVKLTRIV